MKVAIVGLGFAGLRAMQLLERSGITCVGFEARERIGGRCHTIREGDLVYEAGGEWIDADHRRVIELADSHGLPLVGHAAGPRWYRFGDEHCTTSDLWPEAIQDLAKLELAAETAIRHGEPVANQTLQQFIDRFASTSRSRWYLSAVFRSDEGDDPSVIGLAGWLRGYENYLDRTGDELSSLRFSGGSSRLLDAMKDRIVGPIHLNSPVNRMERQDRDWLVREEHFDHVVLTAPPRTYSTISISPELPVPTATVISKLAMSRAIKVSFAFRESWWKEIGWSGSLQVDGPIQQLWDGTLGETPVLNAYICGERRSLSEISDHLFELFPASRELLVSVTEHNWVADPWAAGAFSHFPPGFPVEMLPDAWQPYDGLHFAGEHTARWYGFIEGALESAERATKEITDGNH